MLLRDQFNHLLTFFAGKNSRKECFRFLSDFQWAFAEEINQNANNPVQLPLIEPGQKGYSFKNIYNWQFDGHSSCSMWVDEQTDHAVFVAVRANGVKCSSDFLRNEGVGVQGFLEQLRKHSIKLRIEHLSQFVRHIIQCYHCVLTQVWPQALDQPDDLRHQQPNQGMIQYIAVVLDDSTKFGQCLRTSLPLLRLYLD